MDYSNLKSSPVEVTPEVIGLILEKLTQAGIAPHLKGYECLKVAIGYALENPQSLNAVTKVLYPEVAKLCDTTASRVERAIRHSVEKSFDLITPEDLYALWGNTIGPQRGKPTNSEFIARMAEVVRKGCGAYGKSDTVFKS